MNDLPPKIRDVTGAPAPAPLGPITPPSPPPTVPEGPPVHALSAIVLIAVDNLWNLAEWAVLDWIVTIPLSFITVFVPVFLLQKYLKKDTNGRALAIATVLAVIAAIPTSITGTPVGLALLAWTGLRKWFGGRLLR